MSMIIDSNAIVYPWAMTKNSTLAPKFNSHNDIENSLILLSNTSAALFTVLASQRSSHHACHAKVCLIKLSLFQQFVNDGLLLYTTSSFLDKARVFFHGFKVKVRAETVGGAENQIEKGVCCECPCTALFQFVGIKMTSRSYKAALLLSIENLARRGSRQKFQRGKAAAC
jgi:hypothetical protein